MRNKDQSGQNNEVVSFSQQGIRLISSESLLPERRPLHIQHRGEIYMLRCTRSGKLILTK